MLIIGEGDLGPFGSIHRVQDIATIKHIIKITALILFLVAVTGATAHQVYETHLSSDYQRILRAVMDPHVPFSEMVSYIHDARVAVRTNKDQQTQVKLDRLQDLNSGHAMDVACGSITKLTAKKLPKGELLEGFVAILKCQQVKRDGLFAEQGTLNKELRAIAEIN
jgi:hypothetical protein